jgi:hypothetical protein
MDHSATPQLRCERVAPSEVVSRRTFRVHPLAKSGTRPASYGDLFLFLLQTPRIVGEVITTKPSLGAHDFGQTLDRSSFDLIASLTALQ